MPNIIENHSETVVNVAGIVRRILSHLPSKVTDGLNEIIVLDRNEGNSAFGAYWKSYGRIELYLDGITLWQPWLLKKTYIFPYMSVGMALGHEIDHHVNRNIPEAQKEEKAERNWFIYVYPSLGLFKPVIRILNWVGCQFRIKKEMHR